MPDRIAEPLEDADFEVDDEHRLRLARWDAFYRSICEQVAQHSRCLSRQVGAIIVKDDAVVSMGYNGPPRGITHCNERIMNPNATDPFVQEWCDRYRWPHSAAKVTELDPNRCPRQWLGYKSGEGLHLCPAAHGEENAINNAARVGISCKGATMYMNCGIPCHRCLTSIINAGISEIVVTSLDSLYDKLAGWMIGQGTIYARTYYQPPLKANAA